DGSLPALSWAGKEVSRGPLVCGRPSVAPEGSASEAVCLSALLRWRLCLWNVARQSGLCGPGGLALHGSRGRQALGFRTAPNGAHGTVTILTTGAQDSWSPSPQVALHSSSAFQGTDGYLVCEVQHPKGGKPVKTTRVVPRVSASILTPTTLAPSLKSRSEGSSKAVTTQSSPAASVPGNLTLRTLTTSGPFSPAWLLCEVSGFSPVDILLTWLEDQQEVEPSQFATAHTTAQAGHASFHTWSVLHVSSPLDHVGSTYTCVVSHEASRTLLNGSCSLDTGGEVAPESRRWLRMEGPGLHAACCSQRAEEPTLDPTLRTEALRPHTQSTTEPSPQPKRRASWGRAEAPSWPCSPRASGLGCSPSTSPPTICHIKSLVLPPASHFCGPALRPSRKRTPRAQGLVILRVSRDHVWQMPAGTHGETETKGHHVPARPECPRSDGPPQTAPSPTLPVSVSDHLPSGPERTPRSCLQSWAEAAPQPTASRVFPTLHSSGNPCSNPTVGSCYIRNGIGLPWWPCS
uniref:Ig-like domain-containing protein n=1 Tax=Capra hircus TaxID=9925 RepID=A0A8C2P751_CAPHI